MDKAPLSGGRLSVMPAEHNPPIAVMNNQHVTGNLGATFVRHEGMEAKIEALESRTSGALLFSLVDRVAKQQQWGSACTGTYSVFPT